MIPIFLRAAVGCLAALLPLPALAQESPDAGWAQTYFQEGGGGMPACGICHVLAAAGTEGQVGPSLDDLKPDADRVRAALRDGVGVMPAFAEALSAAEIAAMADYVAGAVE